MFLVAVSGGYAWLAVIAAINAAVGIYYYLRIIGAMYFESAPSGAIDFHGEKTTVTTAVWAAGASLIFGLLPFPLLSLALAGGRIGLG